ncbi:MAG: TolC family protein [Owenweeksia sp.]|nr:TolC family protein [Owenweeksia sp.]
MKSLCATQRSPRLRVEAKGDAAHPDRNFSFQLSAQQPLDSYLTQASQNNPGLQAQYTSFEASLERAAQVSGLPNPTLSFGYFIQPVETRVGPQQAKFSLSQMFPWFGSLSAKGDAAAARAQAQYLRFIDAREKLMSEVKSSYYELWQIREMIELERENLRI